MLNKNIKESEVVLEDGTKLGFEVSVCTAKWRDFKVVSEGSSRTGKYFEVADNSILKDANGNPIVTSYGMELQGSASEIAAAKAAGKDINNIAFSAVFAFKPVTALKTVVIENGKSFVHIMPITLKEDDPHTEELNKLADSEISYWTKYEINKLPKKTVKSVVAAPAKDEKTPVVAAAPATKPVNTKEAK